MKRRKCIGSVKTGACVLEIIQGCHPDRQRWDEESQGIDGNEFVEKCEKGNKKVFYSYNDEKRQAKVSIPPLII